MKTASRIEKLGSALVYCHHALILAVGVFGIFEDPSPTVALVIGGPAASTVWSLMFAVFGALAIGCRLANRRKWLDTTRSEALCIVVIGISMALFGGLIAYSSTITKTPGSLQTALVLLAGSVFLPGVAALSLAGTRRERLSTQDRTSDILNGVRDEIRKHGEAG